VTLRGHDKRPQLLARTETTETGTEIVIDASVSARITARMTIVETATSSIDVIGMVRENWN